MFKKLEERDGFEWYGIPKNSNTALKKLDKGIYDIEIITLPFSQKMLLIPHVMKEELIEPSNEKYDNILIHMNNVFDPRLKEIHEDLKILNKIGIMVHGIPGTGKTSMVKIACMKICEKYDAICLIGKAQYFSEVIDSVRAEDPDRNIIIFVDEFDKVLKGGFTNKTIFMNYLDGNDSRNNVVNVVCLNDYQSIPSEFKNRPSRFKLVEEIDFCDAKLIQNYIEKKIPAKYSDKINIAELSYKLSEGKFTIDKIKHIILDHIAYGTSIDELISKPKAINSISTEKVDIEEEEEANDEDI